MVEAIFVRGGESILQASKGERVWLLTKRIHDTVYQKASLHLPPTATHHADVQLAGNFSYCQEVSSIVR
jgi:hypothetical protein